MTYKVAISKTLAYKAGFFLDKWILLNVLLCIQGALSGRGPGLG